ncbi:hypothetical protein Tco_0622975, partial [Tanacetum coccineum]
MRTRNSNFPNNSNVTIPRRQNKGRAPNIVEPELRTIVAPMAERTMEELLRAPMEGYGECNTPKMGRSGNMGWGMLLHRSIAQDM